MVFGYNILNQFFLKAPGPTTKVPGTTIPTGAEETEEPETTVKPTEPTGKQVISHERGWTSLHQLHCHELLLSKWCLSLITELLKGRAFNALIAYASETR